MAKGVIFKHVRKAGAFSGGELEAGEWGLNVSVPEWYFSHDGTTVTLLATGSLTSEQVEDIIGAMFSGNTETGITATYDDTLGKINLVISALNALPVPTGDLSLNNQKITNLADPVADQDAATKAYVDASRAGLNVKNAVRAATTAALPANTRTGNIVTASSNGALPAQDGVTLEVGEALLVKDEAIGANNGIYEVTTVGSGGAPFVLTRRSDANVSAEVKSGMFVFVSEGTANANSGWVLTTDDPITLNTTALAFAQFSGAGQITAGNGLTKSGNTLNVVGGTGITVNADSIEANFSEVAPASHTHAATDITSGDLATARIQANVVAAIQAGSGGTITNGALILDGGTL